MAPINRRSFVAAFAGLACTALSVRRSDAVKWKTRLWAYTQHRDQVTFMDGAASDPVGFDWRGVDGVVFDARMTHKQYAAYDKFRKEFRNQINADLLSGAGRG